MKSVSHRVKKEIQHCPRHSPYIAKILLLLLFCLEKLYNKTIVDYWGIPISDSLIRYARISCPFNTCLVYIQIQNWKSTAEIWHVCSIERWFGMVLCILVRFLLDAYRYIASAMFRLQIIIWTKVKGYTLPMLYTKIQGLLDIEKSFKRFYYHIWACWQSKSGDEG